MRVHPNGTPLASMIESIQDDGDKKNLISILSMNLLAPLYVRPIDKRTGEIQPFAAFEWVKDDTILEWETRKLRLLEYMVDSQAQVICLQELQLERQRAGRESQADSPLVLPDWIQPMIDKHGYTAILPPQDSLDEIAKRNLRVLGSNSAVSNAILVKKDQWQVLEEPADDDSSKPAKKKNNKGIQRISSGKNSNTMVSVCLAPADDNSQVDPVVVSCVHLDATDERKRILGLTKCLERSRILLDHQTNDPKVVRPLRAILAGDMNAEFVPGSCMEAVLREYQQSKKQQQQQETNMDTETSDHAMAEVVACTEALRLTSEEPPTKQQLEDWRQLRQEAYDLVQDQCVSLDRIPTGPTRCAYDHSASTNDQTERTMQSWKLDHMLYTCSDDGDKNDSNESAGGVRPLAYWATLEADSTACQTGLPNIACPSDHLPIAAVFELPPSAREDESSSILLKKIQELDTQYKEVVAQAKAEAKVKENEIQKKELEKQQKEAAANGETAPVEHSNNSGKKKKKNTNQKRGPPSEEMMELKREFRSRLKVLQKNQAQEREELLRAVGNREKLILQAHYGIPWRRWLEQGAP